MGLKILVIVGTFNEAFRVVTLDGSQQAVVEEVVAGLVVLWSQIAHDDIISITGDDTVDEMCLYDGDIVAFFVQIGQIQGILSEGTHREELCYGAMQHEKVTAQNVHTVRKAITDLATHHLGLGTMQGQAISTHMMDDAVPQRQNGHERG